MRGSSGGAIWEITSDYPEARLSIGADATAGWAIVAAGVHPLHCELFWDGSSLWVADTHGAGGVFLDGARVTDWAQIRGPAELRFGQAALDFETSAATNERMASNPEHARPITRTDMVAPPEERTTSPIFGGAASDDSIPDIDSAKTRVVASPGQVRDEDRTHVVPAPPSKGADLRPRLGGNGAPVQPEATRMVAMPGQPAPAVAPIGHAPAPIVAPPPPGMGIAPAAPAQHAPAAPPAEYLATPFVEGGPSFVGPPTDPRPATPKQNPLADVLEKVLAVLKPQTSAEVLEKSGAKTKQALPVRTWILLGVTLAAAVGLLLWEDEPVEEVAQQAPAQSGTTVNVAAQPPTVPPNQQPSTQPVVQPPVVQPPVVQPPVPQPPVPQPAVPSVNPQAQVPSQPPQPGSTPSADGVEAPVLSLQRRAADLYIAGSYAEALTIYQQLAQAAPQDPSYASMVRILERRLAARCRDGVGPGGEPCTE